MPQYLTQEKLDSIKKELEYLKTVKRLEIAQRIQEAKDLGDLSENAEYAEAKEAFAFNQGKILELEEIIKNAQIISDDSGKSSTIQIGTTFSVRSGKLEKQFTVVGSQEADPSSGKISNESPLGRAFLGHKPGETIEANVPNGKMKFEILKII